MSKVLTKVFLSSILLGFTLAGCKSKKVVSKSEAIRKATTDSNEIILTMGASQEALPICSKLGTSSATISANCAPAIDLKVDLTTFGCQGKNHSSNRATAKNESQNPAPNTAKGWSMAINSNAQIKQLTGLMRRYNNRASITTATAINAR